MSAARSIWPRLSIGRMRAGDAMRVSGICVTLALPWTGCTVVVTMAVLASGRPVRGEGWP